MTDITEIAPSINSDINYEQDAMGTDKLTEGQIEDFPKPHHRLLRRNIFCRHRDIENFLSQVKSERTHSIVTGIGPSGDMHLGHIIPLYFAKYLQSQTGSQVYIPVSDDNEIFSNGKSIQEIQDNTRSNLRNILAMGFDPSRTTIIVDTVDSNTVYPLASGFGSDITKSQVEAIQSESLNIGQMFYPAVQVSHILLPQLVYGSHPSIVISGMDQDPILRLTRDLADKSKYSVDKPGCLLSKSIPSINNKSVKMSTSNKKSLISLNDDKEEIRNKILEAGSGTIKSKDNDDIAYMLLYIYFEEDDEKIKSIHEKYKNGKITQQEVREIAIEKIHQFISEHKARKKSLDIVNKEIEPYRLTKTQRMSALTRMGYSTELQIN